MLIKLIISFMCIGTSLLLVKGNADKGLKSCKVLHFIMLAFLFAIFVGTGVGVFWVVDNFLLN